MVSRSAVALGHLRRRSHELWQLHESHFRTQAHVSDVQECPTALRTATAAGESRSLLGTFSIVLYCTKRNSIYCAALSVGAVRTLVAMPHEMASVEITLPPCVTNETLHMFTKYFARIFLLPPLLRYDMPCTCKNVIASCPVVAAGTSIAINTCGKPLPTCGLASK